MVVPSAILFLPAVGAGERQAVGPNERHTTVKNQYFGDVNDYRKYGLLRCLIEATGLPLGVCWLLTENDGRSDGEFRRYLADPRKWRRYDPELFDRLNMLCDPSVPRQVSWASDWNLLPGATYFASVVRDHAAARRSYFEDALQELSSCPLIFFDPDNGLEVSSVQMGRIGSSKYIYRSDVEMAYAAGHSLVIYQHFARVSRDTFTKRLATSLAERLRSPLVDSFATAHVVFFLVARAEHVARFAVAHRVIEERWKGQITPLAHAPA